MEQDSSEHPKAQFLVRRSACKTCIYRDNCPLDIERLEGETRDEYGATVSYRICHQHHEACCRGFWNRHAKDLAAARLAKILGIVRFIDDDEDPELPRRKMRRRKKA